MWAAPNYEVLLAGRIAYGLGIGFAMHAAPAYIAECVSGPGFASSSALFVQLSSCSAAKRPGAPTMTKQCLLYSDRNAGTAFHTASHRCHPACGGCSSA